MLKMPKCLLNSLRGYKTRKYVGDNEYDPCVMTTRSGLSIRTAPRGPMTSIIVSSSTHRGDPPPPVAKKKNTTIKHRSLSHLSFVTRFHICRRMPELDLAGVGPRDFANWKEELTALREADQIGNHKQQLGTTSSKEVDTFVVLDTVAEDNYHLYDDSHEYGDITNNAAIDPNTSDSSEEASRIVSGFSLLNTSCGMLQSTTRTIDDLADGIQHSRSSERCVSLSQPASGTELTQTPLSEKLHDLKVTDDTVDYDEDGFSASDDSDDSLSDDDLTCRDCDIEFPSRAPYNAHMWIHGKTRNSCNICGKAFTRSWLLKGHLRIHTGERPFRCSYPDCDKAFADKSNLRSHVLIHTTQKKSYVCPKCSRAFAQKRYLHKHMLEVCRII